MPDPKSDNDVSARGKLLEQLTSPSEAARLRAVEALGEDASEAAMQALLGALGDESWRVRQAVVKGLAQRGGDKTSAALLRAIRHEHHSLNVLNSAIQALAASELDVLEPLMELLNAAEADLRTYAALTLGECGDPRAIPALLAALDDDDANARYHAIEALGKLRAHQAVDALLALAQERDFALSFPALDALAAIGDALVAPQIVPLLEDELLRTAAADALGKLGDELAVAPLAALLNKPGAPARACARALAALHGRCQALYRQGDYIAELARAAVEPLGIQNLLAALPGTRGDELRSLALVLGWLEGAEVERALAQLLNQPAARQEAAQALVRYGARVTGLLLEQLDARELETRQAAVVALGRIGGSRAALALTRALADEELALAAAEALTKLGHQGAFEPLLELLNSPQASLRQAAIAALNSLGHPDMPNRVLALLRDPDPLLRQSAVQIAGYFGYPECTDFLFERCQDEDEGVRQAALESLPYLEDERVLPALAAALREGPRKARAAAARALAQVEGPSALPHLLQALEDTDLWVRYYAARSLGQLGSPEALPALGRAVQEDRVPMVRASAAEALGRIGGARAVAALAPLVGAKEADLARAALKALGQVEHPAALTPLLDALRAPEPERRLDALHAVAQRGRSGAASALQEIAINDAEPGVAQAALEALACLATPEAIAALASLAAEPAHYEACVAALAGLGEGYVEEIAGGLDHAQPAVRRATVSALARIQSPLASERLSAALQNGDASVRLMAVTELRRLGSRSSQQALAELAHADPDPTVQRAARVAEEQ